MFRKMGQENSDDILEKMEGVTRKKLKGYLLKWRGSGGLSRKR